MVRVAESSRLNAALEGDDATLFECAWSDGPDASQVVAGQESEVVRLFQVQRRGLGVWQMNEVRTNLGSSLLQSETSQPVRPFVIEAGGVALKRSGELAEVFGEPALAERVDFHEADDADFVALLMGELRKAGGERTDMASEAPHAVARVEGCQVDEDGFHSDSSS
jgi:hypothetical protein